MPEPLPKGKEVCDLPDCDRRDPALGTAGQDAAVFLATAGKAVGVGLSLGEMTHSLIVQHLHSLLAKPEGEVQVKPLCFG